MLVIRAVDVGVEPERTTQVIDFSAAVNDTLQSHNFGFGKRCKHVNFHNITSSDAVWNIEISLALDSLVLLAFYVAQKRLAFVHGWTRQLWWPVEFGLVPLGQSLLLLVPFIVALVRDMNIVVADLGEDGPLISLPVDLLRLRAVQVFLEPLLELLVLGQLLCGLATFADHDLDLLDLVLGSLLLLSLLCETSCLDWL